PSVERALERDELRSSCRPSRPLQRGLDGFRSRVAEEGARASEPSRKPGRELLHRLCPVEARDMPEALELSLGRRQRSGMPVSEPDDCDPGDEVEVPPIRLVDEPGPVAVNKGHV